MKYYYKSSILIIKSLYRNELFEVTLVYITSIQEAEIERIMVWGYSRQNVCKLCVNKQTGCAGMYLLFQPHGKHK
jgi:hypothetical protein